MTTFWEGVAHSVNYMFSLLCLFVVLVVSHLGFKGRSLVLIAPVPGDCFPFTLTPLVTNGISHPYHLDESTFNFRVIRSDLSFLFHFSMKIM